MRLGLDIMHENICQFNGPAPGAPVLHVNALWGVIALTDHSSPTEVKRLDQEVKPSFNKTDLHPVLSGSHAGTEICCDG